MALKEYKKKRTFTDTPEQGGKSLGKPSNSWCKSMPLRVCIASFRLEMEGVLEKLGHRGHIAK